MFIVDRWQIQNKIKKYIFFTFFMCEMRCKNHSKYWKIRRTTESDFQRQGSHDKAKHGKVSQISHNRIYWNVRLIVVLVHSGIAEVLITGILLDRRSRPASERVPIIVRRIVIVVSIPQWQVRERRRAAHDRIPLTGAGINAQVDATFTSTLNHGRQKVHVCGRRTRPVLQI